MLSYKKVEEGQRRGDKGGRQRGIEELRTATKVHLYVCD